MTTATTTRRSRSHASRAADATQLPVRDEPSEAARADRAASRRRGQQPATPPTNKSENFSLLPLAPPDEHTEPEPAAEHIGMDTADFQQFGPEPEQPPEPKPLTPTQQRVIALSALNKAGADVVEHWDAAATGVSQEAAREAIAHRLSYSSPLSTWDDRLGERVRRG